MDPEKTEAKESIWSRLYNGHTKLSFVGRRHRWYAFSGIVILVGIASLGVRGLNFGIEFRGGTSWDVTNTSLTVSQAQRLMTNLGVKQPTIVALGSGKSTTIEVQADLSALNSSAKTSLVNKITDSLATIAHTQPSKVSLNDVGPTWGGEITTKALQALAGFFIAITLYITLRFELKMAAAAMLAVVHDILVTIGIYALVGFEVTPATVIALLTILGYSLYDTIVVFDRVQENVKELVNPGRMSYSDAVDLSMNQVLMRSMNTSIVAIIPILSVLLIGAELLGATTLQQFGLALFIGLTTGAYSSLFIASPVLATLKSREPRYRALARRLEAKEASKGQKAQKKLADSLPTNREVEAVIPEVLPEGSHPLDGSITSEDSQDVRPKLVEPGFRSSSSRSGKPRKR